MASFSKTALIFVLVIFIFYIHSLEGRKVLSLEKTKAATLGDNSVLKAFGKFDYKLAKKERLTAADISQDGLVVDSASVPSPGQGHRP